mgnify:CR=1 FL=1
MVLNLMLVHVCMQEYVEEMLERVEKMDVERMELPVVKIVVERMELYVGQMDV